MNGGPNAPRGRVRDSGNVKCANGQLGEVFCELPGEKENNTKHANEGDACGAQSNW